MRLLSALLFILLICSCNQHKPENSKHRTNRETDSITSEPLVEVTYENTKERITNRRKKLAARYLKSGTGDKQKIEKQITDCWAQGIGNDLYKHWAGTPWDFNGTTLVPKQGSIACGYFVTTLLLDMGLQINRVKLSTCAASEMMQKLTPHQPIKKLNSLTYNEFCNYLKNGGKGVYIIGLDFHVGFLVNDGKNTWFVHSNYINKQGVVKELIQYSAALKASNTRWIINLTDDKDFIGRWLADKN